MGTLRLAAVFGGAAVLEGVLQANAERVFLVSELVDEIARVAPEREIGIRGRSVERRARAVLIVVVEQISGIVRSGACGRREGVERDVGGPPAGLRVERNLEEERLSGSSPTPRVWCEGAEMRNARHRA
jgi:hypothetical protein